MKAAILTDVTKCIGCRECVAACKVTWNLRGDVPRRWSRDDGLSALNWTSIIEKGPNEYIRKQCRHCEEPACAAACPVGALHTTDLGAVVYDAHKCLGCRYCMMACPYGIPRYDWDSAVPYVRKCILCYPRVKDGKEPACTAACPVDATIFGDRDELIAEAKRRIAAEPDKYIDHIWGEKEVGGTSVLYISHVDLSCLSYGRPLDNKPLPARTAPAMNAVLPTFGVMFATMAGLGWLMNRKHEVAQTEAPPAAEEPEAPATEEPAGDEETKSNDADDRGEVGNG